MARPASDIRARLIAAARKRFLEDGADGASLRTIAKDARTNVGMIVYWFETKDELFLAVVEDVYATLLAELEAILARPAPVRVRLQAAFTRLGNVSDVELDTIRLVLREALLVPRSPRFERLVSRFQAGHLAMIGRALFEAVQHGEVDASIPLPLLMLATFGMGGASQIVRRIVGSAVPIGMLPPTEELAARAVDILYGGIGAKPSAPARSAVADQRAGDGDDRRHEERARDHADREPEHALHGHGDPLGHDEERAPLTRGARKGGGRKRKR